MVIVLCVLAVFLALSAAILLSGSVALNTARTNLVFERAKVQAVSLGDVLVKDMLLPLNGKGSYLAHYVRDSIMSEDDPWPCYDEAADNRKEAIRVFTMDKDDSKKHQITIEMYWTGDDKPNESSLKADGTVDTRNIELTIDVVSTLNGSEFRVRNQFKLEQISENTKFIRTQAVGAGNYPCIWTWDALGRE